jgi:hypothetical protein
VQFEDYTTCDNAFEVAAVHIINQVLDQPLIRSEEELEEAEQELAAEDEVTFLDTLKGLEAARKNTCQLAIEDNTTVICKTIQIDNGGGGNKHCSDLLSK